MHGLVNRQTLPDTYKAVFRSCGGVCMCILAALAPTGAEKWSMSITYATACDASFPWSSMERRGAANMICQAVVLGHLRVCDALFHRKLASCACAPVHNHARNL